MDDKAKKDIAKIQVDIAEIKVDLKHHVKRTDDLQNMVQPLVDLRREIKGVVKLIYLISALATIVECARMFWH
jgi:hypothetical protein